MSKITDYEIKESFRMVIETLGNVKNDGLLTSQTLSRLIKTVSNIHELNKDVVEIKDKMTDKVLLLEKEIIALKRIHKENLWETNHCLQVLFFGMILLYFIK